MTSEKMIERKKLNELLKEHTYEERKSHLKKDVELVGGYRKFGSGKGYWERQQIWLFLFLLFARLRLEGNFAT